MAIPEARSAAPPTFGPDDAGRPTSSDEFAVARFLEPWKYERVAGRLVVMSPDSEAHDQCSEPLRDRLGAYRLARPDVVQYVVSEAWVRIDEGTDRIGDIGVYLASSRASLARPDRVPEIMFEIVSFGDRSRVRDYVEKRDQYRGLGVLEDVVVDRYNATFTVFSLTDEGYAERVLSRNESYESPFLPGLTIPLSELLP
jgi:Uma2 family endonuclease